MNLLLHSSAHDNIASRIINRVESRARGANPGFLERFLIVSGVCAGWFLLACCRCADFVCRAVFKANKPVDLKADMKNARDGISVIIVNWNGEDLLRRCLPALDETLARASFQHEVIVADNGSTDGSVSLIEKQFPHVRVLRLKKNLGFGPANNLAAGFARHDLLLLLNNDMLLNADALPVIMGYFSDPDVFAVAPKAVRPDGALAEGHSWCEVEDNGPEFYNERQFPDSPCVKSPAPTLYALGACAMVRKDVFIKLGGFDSLYYPFYWEDNDLSYRALKRGYRVIYDPSATVVHEHGASSRRLSPFYILSVMEKNSMLFFLKNMTDTDLFRSVLKGLRFKLDRAVKEKDYARLMSFILAFLQTPAVIRRRIAECRNVVAGDSDVIKMAQQARPRRNST